MLFRLREYVQYAAHGVQDHFEHGFWAETGSDHIRHCLFNVSQTGDEK